MTKILSLTLRAAARAGTVLFFLLPSSPARAGDMPPAPAGVAPVSVQPVSAVPPRESVKAGTTVRIDGARDRRFGTMSGASVHALAGAVFAVVTDTNDTLVLRLDEGTLADVGGSSGRSEIHTRAFTVRGERARVSVRDLPGGVYAEHVATSTGTVSLMTPGRADVALAAGTFRMATFDEATSAPTVAGHVSGQTNARVATVTPSVTSTSYRPAGSYRPEGGLPAPTAIVSNPVRAAVSLTMPVSSTMYGANNDSYGRPVVPAPGPCVGGCGAPAPVRYVPCAPAPCTPIPVCTTGCGEMITTSGVPVPDRADDAGRIPLGSAIGARGPCDSCAGTECNRIPYVHYVEGLVCDVSTYKVGCCLITVRPASRVRVHRLPDGSLQMWAPNIGKDLALIEINDNQFGYIGEDGFLVIGSDCQIDYFRGLVHLYPRRTPRYNYDRPRRPNDRPASEDRVTVPVMTGPVMTGSQR